MTKREIGFALSLITTIISPIFLWFSFEAFISRFMWRLIWDGLDFSYRLIPVVTFSLIGLIILIMVAGLLFMGISKTKMGRIIGGVIILSVGVTGLVVPFMLEGIEGSFLLIPAVMATIGGYLGIRGAREDEVKKKQYSKKFIFRVSIMGFISALLLVFIFWYMAVMPTTMEGYEHIIILYYVFFPFWIISVILNTISTVVIKRKETIPQKRTKIPAIILITVTWCIIASVLVVPLLWRLLQ